MEDSNPQGTGKTVDQAAASIFGMLDPQQPEGQVEERQEEETAEYVEESEPEEVEASEETQEEVEEAPRCRVKVGGEFSMVHEFNSCLIMVTQRQVQKLWRKDSVYMA